MIVQCDQCNSKFRLDDSKVKEGGVKVRCSKCKNIFFVQTESPAEEAEFDTFLSGLMSRGAEPGGTEIQTAAEPPVSQQPPGKAERPDKTTLGSTVEDKSQGQDDFDLGEFTFNEQTPGPEPSPSPVEEPLTASRDDFDLSEFTFSEESLASAPHPGQSSKAELHGDAPLNFGELDLGGAELELNIDGITHSAGNVTEASAIPPEQPKIEKIDSTTVPEDFSFDTEFGSPPSEKSGEDFFTKDSPAFSFEPEDAGVPFALPGQKEPKIPLQPEPFDFGAFESGDSAAPEPVETVKHGLEFEGKDVPAFSRISAPPVPEMPAFEEELPPLSISSRRRSGSNMPITLIVVSVIILACAAGGFYLFREGPVAFDRMGLGFITSWFGAGSKEEGNVAVRNISSQFLNNKEMGEIFVIKGEAVNNYGKPRASIQVKATLFGAKGAVVMHKVAYCGNLLSGDQLTTLPAAKIEAAMNNQFGDSLSNLAVQPGKGIPFVIVLSSVPKEIAEFGVEVVGSTVSTQ